jgi:serine/threonine protein kinase
MSATDKPVSSDPAGAPTELEPSSLLTGTTGPAPPFPPPMKMKPLDRGSLPSLAPGTIIGDFEILRLLGTGGFASVYLARQISLDRQVALKVSPNCGDEARSLARLEHRHIVQIFDATVEPARNLKLLWMQFVPGVTLARLIAKLAQVPWPTWSGRTVLNLLDKLSTEPTTLDLSGLADRAFLERCDHAELTCWFGARLAEALAHAHSQGVIHRDVKPANILVNRYGRPFLADFNISLNAQSGEGIFGGTLSYMAPEHLLALKLGTPAAQAAVDERADLYSLALVLVELLTGQLLLPNARDSMAPAEIMEALIALRQQAPTSPRALQPAVPELPDRLLRRCLEPAPARRFASAESFMNALDGCRELLRVEKETDTRDAITRWCRARPFLMVILLGIVPNLIGSIVNVSYNALLIIDKNPAQQACFESLILGYNAVTYPLLMLVSLVVLKRAYRGWQRLQAEDFLPLQESARIRRQILALPIWSSYLASAGFPAGLSSPCAFMPGPVRSARLIHCISFCRLCFPA